MGKGISVDLRRRVIAAWQREGLTARELAERFDVGVASVVRWKQLYRETGDVFPRPHGGGMPRKIRAEHEPLVEALVRAHPDWTEDEYAKALLEQQGIEASAATVGRVIRSLGYTVKKRPSLRASETSLTSDDDESNTSSESGTSPLRVWFSWTKPAST